MIKIAYLVLALISNAWAGYYFTPEQVFPQRPLNFFWSSSGNDSNSCKSPVQACQTISHFNAFSFPQGATVHFHGGDSFSGGLTNFSVNMTVTSYGTGRPTISSGNSAACASITNVAGVTINNLNCTGGGNTTNTTQGIVFTNTATNTQLSGATVTNNTVIGYGSNGIWVNGTVTGAGFKNITITNNIVHDVTGNDTSTPFTSCIFIQNNTDHLTSRTTHQNATVNNNLAYNCTGTNGNANGSGAGIAIQATTTGTVNNNVVHDFAANNSACGGPVGIILQDTDSFTVNFNEVYHGSPGTGCDGEGMDIDGDVINTVMNYNYVHDMAAGSSSDVVFCGCNPSPGSSLAWNNNTFAFNIIVSPGGHPAVLALSGHSAGGAPFQPTTNLLFFNNTVWSSGNGVNGPFSTSSVGNDLTGTFANNIFVATGGNIIYNPIGTPPNVLFAGNDYFNSGGTFTVEWGAATYTTLAGFQTTGQEKVGGNPVGIAGNPSLANGGAHPFVGGYSPPFPIGYHPAGGSPVLPNAGLNITTDFSISPGTQDFYGNAVTASTLPIGAGAVIFTSPGASSISLVQDSGFANNAGAGISKSVTINGTTAGNLLVVGVVWCNTVSCNLGGATISTVTASNGETCSQVTGAAVSQDVAVDIWYCNNLVGGSDTVTVTASTSVFYMGVDLVELHGASPNPIDGVTNNIFSNSNGNTSYSIPTGDLTLEASEFIYSMGVVGNNPSLTFGQTQLNPNIDQYQISGAAGALYSNTATWTNNGTNVYAVGLAGFK